VDGLIAKCDASNRDDAYRGISAGPFTVFASRSIRVPSPRRLPSDIIGILDEGHDAQLKDHAGFLFHHYSTYIAKNMMPFEDRRNPWRSFYPLMARCGTSRGHRALLHAMLAQAAGNLAYLGSDVELMSILTVKHYALAIENLRRGLEDDWKDFSVVLASVLTLIMAEVKNLSLRDWKVVANIAGIQR
jgi:Fungal specific transcription factor domain